MNILETDNEDGLNRKYCPIASSMSAFQMASLENIAFQMNNSALTVGAAATDKTPDSSWNRTCNHSKEDQVEQQQEFPTTYMNNSAEAQMCPYAKGFRWTQLSAMMVISVREVSSNL